MNLESVYISTFTERIEKSDEKSFTWSSFIASRYEFLPSTLEEDVELVYLHLFAGYSVFSLPPQYLTCNNDIKLKSFIVRNLRYNHISLNVGEIR